MGDKDKDDEVKAVEEEKEKEEPKEQEKAKEEVIRGIPVDEVIKLYMQYYKKSLNPKNCGVETVEAVLALVRDTAIVGVRSKLVEPTVTDELAFNDIFVRLTEDARRNRKR